MYMHVYVYVYVYVYVCVYACACVCVCVCLIFSQQVVEGIGRGGFGVVYRGINVDTGETVAIKRIGLQNISQEDLDAIEVRDVENTNDVQRVKHSLWHERTFWPALVAKSQRRTKEQIWETACRISRVKTQNSVSASFWWLINAFLSAFGAPSPLECMCMCVCVCVCSSHQMEIKLLYVCVCVLLPSDGDQVAVCMCVCAPPIRWRSSCCMCVCVCSPHQMEIKLLYVYVCVLLPSDGDQVAVCVCVCAPPIRWRSSCCRISVIPTS